MENVNQRIFRLLGSKHGIQKDLADFIGIDAGVINKWKKRGSGIDSELIPGIADYLGVTDTYLLRGEDESFSSEELKLIGLFYLLVNGTPFYHFSFCSWVSLCGSRFTVY